MFMWVLAMIIAVLILVVIIIARNNIGMRQELEVTEVYKNFIEAIKACDISDISPFRFIGLMRAKLNEIGRKENDVFLQLDMPRFEPILNFLWHLSCIQKMFKRAQEGADTGSVEYCIGRLNELITAIENLISGFPLLALNLGDIKKELPVLLKKGYKVEVIHEAQSLKDRCKSDYLTPGDLRGFIELTKKAGVSWEEAGISQEEFPYLYDLLKITDLNFPS